MQLDGVVGTVDGDGTDRDGIELQAERFGVVLAVDRAGVIEDRLGAIEFGHKGASGILSDSESLILGFVIVVVVPLDSESGGITDGREPGLRIEFGGEEGSGGGIG